MLSELPDRVLSLSLDFTVSTAGLGLTTLSREMGWCGLELRLFCSCDLLLATGSGNLKCCEGLTTQGGVVSGWEVTITCGLEGVLELQLLELESKGGGWLTGCALGRLGLPSLVMCSK